MDRKKQLKDLIKLNNDLVDKLIDDLVFMESQLEYYRTLPQIRVDENNPARQKATPASKHYKETLQQYTNVIKVLARCTGQDLEDEDSPLRNWAKEFAELKKGHINYVNSS